MTCEHNDIYWTGHVLFCDDCGADVTPKPGEHCLYCGGDGHNEDVWCLCEAGQKQWAELESRMSYMIPMVKRAMAAKRAGDDEEYERIRLEAIR